LAAVALPGSLACRTPPGKPQGGRHVNRLAFVP